MAAKKELTNEQLETVAGKVKALYEEIAGLWEEVEPRMPIQDPALVHIAKGANSLERSLRFLQKRARLARWPQNRIDVVFALEPHPFAGGE